MIKTFLVLLTTFILEFSFLPSVLAQGRECNDANEGQRIGPYVCRDGDWIRVDRQ